MKKTMADYKFFKDYFTIPPIISYNYDKRIIIKEFISSKPKDEWKDNDYERIINSIFENYKSYYRSIKYKKELEDRSAKYYYTKLVEDDIFKELVYKLKSKISDDLFYSEFPLVYQHGDLHLQNIILGKNGKIYYIDWDYVVYAIFFYDFLNGKQLECDYTDNFKTLKNYLQGLYDSYYIKIFSLFGYDFKTDKRIEYIYIYILEDIYLRTLHWVDSSKRNLVKKYEQLLQQLENELN
ncbi:MAG TPA: phosphotransferase [Tepidimicrobium sp.]|nr:phosphotransferase [Tepidimicrobium sp.]